MADVLVNGRFTQIVFGALMHAGQICMSTERIIVVESVADKLIEELRIISEGDLKDLGSLELASDVGVGKMRRLVDDAVEKVRITPSQGTRVLSTKSLTSQSDGTCLQGAKAITVDYTHSENLTNQAYPPTVLIDVPPSASIYYEESFGPALILIRAKDVDEAVTIANDSDVGLSSSVWTSDLREGIAVARRIEAGAVSSAAGLGLAFESRILIQGQG